MENSQARSLARHEEPNEGTSAVLDLENTAAGKLVVSPSSPSLPLLSRGSYRHYNKHRKRVSLKQLLTPAGGAILQAAGLFLVFAFIHQYLKRYSICVRGLSKSTPEAPLATPGYSRRNWIVPRRLAAGSNNGGNAPRQDSTGPLGESPNQWCIHQTNEQVVYYSAPQKIVYTWDRTAAGDSDYVHMNPVYEDEYVDMHAGSGGDNYVDLHRFDEDQETALVTPDMGRIERVLVHPVSEVYNEAVRPSRGETLLLKLFRGRHLAFAAVVIAALTFAGVTWYRSSVNTATPAEVYAAMAVCPGLLALVLAAFIASAHYEYTERGKRTRQGQLER